MNQVNVAAAAAAFHNWAISEGLCQAPLVHLDDGQPIQVEPISELGKQTLKQKQIQFVAFSTAKSTITAYLRRAAPRSKKILAALPQSVNGYSVAYRQGAEPLIKILDFESQGSPPWTVRTTAAGITTYACGSSISAGNIRDAGTLGCFLRDGSGRIFGLTNNHVTGACNHSPIALPILAPGVHDVAPGGLNPFTIGHHSHSLPMVPGDPSVVSASSNFDAAVFSVLNPATISSFQGQAYDTPAQVKNIIDGMEIEKVGRTTGHTVGVIREQVVGPLPISYSSEPYGFKGRVYFEPVFIAVGKGTAFSDNGDSGSLVVAADPDFERVAVGIVTGGSDDGHSPGGKISVILPIRPILERLKMTLLHGHNV